MSGNGFESAAPHTPEAPLIESDDSSRVERFIFSIAFMFATMGTRISQRNITASHC